MTDHETTTALIDQALDAGRPTSDSPEDRLLQELTLAVRDDAPVADPDFERRLDERVAAGFGRSERRMPALPAFLRRRPTLTALGVAASLLLALVVTVSLSGREDGSGTIVQMSGDEQSGAGGGAVAEKAEPALPAGPEAPAQTAPQAAPAPAAQGAPAAAGDTAARSAAPQTEISPLPPIEPPIDPVVPGRRRDVQRSALLTLAAPGDRLDDVADGVVAVTDRYRGFVMRSSVTAGDDGSAGGSFDLRIPVRNLRPALRDLSQLADVRARTESAEDVTASFRSARTRLQELRAQRRGLLRRLERSDTDAEQRAIRAQIRFVNAELDAATRRLTQMRRSTSYASIAVALVADETADAGGGDLSDGWNDMKDNLVDSANVALRVLGVALPLALIAAVAWFLAGAARRHSREAALDRPATVRPPAETG